MLEDDTSFHGQVLPNHDESATISHTERSGFDGIGAAIEGDMYVRAHAQ